MSSRDCATITIYIRQFVCWQSKNLPRLKHRNSTCKHKYERTVCTGELLSCCAIDNWHGLFNIPRIMWIICFRFNSVLYFRQSEGKYSFHNSIQMICVHSNKASMYISECFIRYANNKTEPVRTYEACP